MGFTMNMETSVLFNSCITSSNKRENAPKKLRGRNSSGLKTRISQSTKTEMNGRAEYTENNYCCCVSDTVHHYPVTKTIHKL